MSALDKLNKLNQKLETKKEEKKTDNRPEMSVPPAVKQSLARLLPAQRLAKYCEQRIEIENAIVSEEMLGVYAEILWHMGCRPTNPRIVCEHEGGRPDMNGLYQVQERFKLVYDKGETPVKDRLRDSLIKAGFTELQAVKVLDGEVNCQPMTVLRPLDELAVGNAVEQSAANKVIDFIFGQPADPFTPEEAAVATKKIERCEVRDGFLERVKVYCNNVQQLKMLFKVIVPVNFVSHAKFSDDQTQNFFSWLVEQARAIVTGTKLKK